MLGLLLAIAATVTLVVFIECSSAAEFAIVHVRRTRLEELGRRPGIPGGRRAGSPPRR
jgi:hypothetical protein